MHRKPSEVLRRPYGDRVRRVLANPALRKIQLAFAGSLLGDWAYATAITVWAYQEAGPAAVGVFAAVRYIAMALAGPLGALVADRVSRRAFMMTTDLVRALLVSVAAVVVSTDGPAALVYVLGVAAAAVGAPFRSAQAGLLPSLVDDPRDLTASNALAANLENVAVFAGPALGAFLVGVTDVATVFWLNVATYLWSFLLIWAIRVPVRARAGGSPRPPEPAGLLREVGAGVVTVSRDRDLRTVAALSAAQGFVWGALTVFMVVMAVRTLGWGPEGVGYLDALLGVGTVVGGAVILSRVGKGRLGVDMAVGVLGWSLPLVAFALFPHPATVIAALAVIGVADPWVNVGLETIPQRIAPEQLISRVYAAVDSALTGSMALGAALAPLLIHLLGFRGAVGAVGVVVAAYAATTFGRLAALDSRLAAPEALPLVRSISMFAALPPPVQEVLARALRPETHPPGADVVVEGEAADRFYVIRSGSVLVTAGASPAREQGPGDFFGEIGLLREVPRTATVTAGPDGVELGTLDRDDFLDAVTGVGEARLAAEEVVSRRLGV